MDKSLKKLTQKCSDLREVLGPFDLLTREFLHTCDQSDFDFRRFTAQKIVSSDDLVIKYQKNSWNFEKLRNTGGKMKERVEDFSDLEGKIVQKSCQYCFSIIKAINSEIHLSYCNKFKNPKISSKIDLYKHKIDIDFESKRYLLPKERRVIDFPSRNIITDNIFTKIEAGYSD